MTRRKDVYLLVSRKDISVNSTIEGAQEAAQRFHRARVGYHAQLDWEIDPRHYDRLCAEGLGYVYEITLMPVGE